MKASLRTAVVAALLAAGLSASLSARQTCATAMSNPVIRSNPDVKIILGNSAADIVAGGAGSLSQGFLKWNNASCRNLSNPENEEFPSFHTYLQNPPEEVLIQGAHSAPPGFDDVCADFLPSLGIVTLYQYWVNPATGQQWECDWSDPEYVAAVVAHELGHYFNLDENSCPGGIMNVGQQQFYGNKTIFPLAGWDVTTNECAAADALSPMPAEIAACTGDPFHPDCNPGGTPVIVQLDGMRFDLTSYEDGVNFDLDADGVSERLGWTEADSLGAFLAMDRDGDGRIGDGRELFGDSTPLLGGGVAVHGFEALSELDQVQHGGNEDGFLSGLDARWGELLLWVDKGHDGVADPAELFSLQSLGVMAIGVEFVESRRSDAYGNRFRYVSWGRRADQRGRLRRIGVVDVILVREP